MISVQQALDALTAHRPDWGQEDLPLSQLTGRVLANDILAPFDHPRAATSVMDGYAFRRQDVGEVLTIIGQSRAGEPFDGTIGEKEAIRIFTGALLPTGANMVEMQENAVLTENNVSFPTPSLHRDFTRKAGTDFKKSDRLFSKGQTITPAMILGLATCNLKTVSVERQPTVALLSSGDELVPVGSDLGVGTIVNSIGPALTALLTTWGVSVIDLGIARDTPEHIAEKLSACDADIIVPIGAASVGDYDFMQSVAGDLAYTSIFSKVAIKPGKPSWFSKKGDQCLLGLPGNPSSAWVCANIFLKHLIFGPQILSRAKLAHDIAENGPRECYFRGRHLPSGEIEMLSKQDSGLVTPLSDANILIRLMPLADLQAGEMCEYLVLD